jgi:cytochrome c-type biogenesis protein CcmF
VFGAAAQWVTPKRYDYLMPYVAAVTSMVTLFFVSVVLFASNPFERLAFTPPDGNGLNPQLQNPGMVIHPPMLYLGYISITIPFAFAVAALITKRLDTGWLHAIRRWTIVSWIFLSVGIVLGMWWAYVELGWGGYWAWDPVENASFLPWLTMTAFLHSVMIQEKRGMLKKWNMILIILSFMLSIWHVHHQEWHHLERTLLRSVVGGVLLPSLPDNLGNRAHVAGPAAITPAPS